MAKNENMPQNNELFLNVDNFLKVKKQLKEMHKDCTDRKLAQVLNCNIRTVQKYRSATNQFPIPLLRLEKLAQYMDVSPDWLCGYPMGFFGGVGWSEDQHYINVSMPTDRRKALEKYLETAGIKAKRMSFLVWDEKDGLTDIEGHAVSIEQYDRYLDEIEAAIKYITGRFIKHIKE